MMNALVMVTCSDCGESVPTQEFSFDTEKCLMCYADGIGHGCEASSKSEASGWILEMYPQISTARLEAAMRVFLSYHHTARLPFEPNPTR